MGFSCSIFVTGTDTDVGKTLASALFVRYLHADYWKPVQSGLDGETDDQVIARLTADLSPASTIHPSRFRLTQPLSPHEAARRDGIPIQLSDFVLPQTAKKLVVEGAGGVMVPLNDQDWMLDLMVQLKLPIVVVARSTLGTINHSMLSLLALKGRGLRVLGWVVNGPHTPHNEQALTKFSDLPILARIPRLDNIDGPTLDQVIDHNRHLLDPVLHGS